MKNTPELFSRKKGSSKKIKTLLIPACFLLIITEVSIAQHPSKTAVNAPFEQILSLPELTSDRVILFEDSFESYEDFSDSLGDWTLTDLDMTPTYFIDEAEYPGEGLPMAFIVFNPLATNPPLDGPWLAAAGNKYAASFSSIPGEGGPNNNWLITPKIELKWQSEFRFMAKSVTPEYGLEQFRVGISTTDTGPDSFEFITGPDTVNAPAEWTVFRYEIPEFDSDSVHIAIQNVSDDRFVFMIDDFQVTGTETPPVSVADGSENVPDGIVLHQNYPNPFNPVTSIRFTLKEPETITLTVYSISGTRIAVLAEGRYSSGTHTTVFDGSALGSGVYFYRLETGKFITSRKLVLMK
jgi:hypothetical protein